MILNYEFERNSVVAKNATTAKDGKIYQVGYYNLDVIISVGYRIRSLNFFVLLFIQELFSIQHARINSMQHVGIILV